MADAGLPLHPKDVQPNGYSTLANIDEENNHAIKNRKTPPDYELSDGLGADCIEVLTCRSDRERSQGLMVLVLLVVTIVFSMGIVLQKHTVDKYKKDNIVCDLTTCTIVGAWTQTKMLQTTHPCDNFYKYACGSWVRGIGVPPETPTWTSLDEITHENFVLLNSKLKASDNKVHGRPSTALTQVNTYHKACMDLNQIERANSAPLLELLNREEFGGWPVLSPDWDPSKWNVTNTLIELNKLSVTPFFAISVERDMKQVKRHIITLTQGGLTLNGSPLYYEHTISDHINIREAYIRYFTEIAEQLGKGGDDNIKQVADEIWKLEVELSSIFVSPKEQQDPNKTYNLQTIEYVDDLFGSSIDFKTVLEGLFNKPFDGKTNVLVKTPPYFAEIQTVLSKTSKTTMANYIMWLLVHSMVPHMAMRLRTSSLMLYKVVTGAAELESQWLTCVMRADDAMKYATGSLFTQSRLGNDWWDIDRISEIVEYSQAAMQYNIARLERMDKETRDKSHNKVQHIKYQLGYPAFILNVTDLDRYYSSLERLTQDSFSNELKIRRFAVAKNLDTLEKLPDRNEWKISIVKAEAVNNYMDNELLVSAGLLSQPMFATDHSLFWTITYGSIGVILNRLMTHSIDQLGGSYDEHGNYMEGWIKQSTDYIQGANCFIRQFDEYYKHEKNLDGELVVRDIMTDQSGLKHSFMAYKRWTWDKDLEEDRTKLPGLNISHHQLFFLSFAQAHCTYNNPDSAVSTVESPHVYIMHRINGAMINSADFSKAYDCKLDEEMMNPSDKCTIW